MPCAPSLALIVAPGAARPWWASDLMSRLMRPNEATLVPLLGMVLLALVTGWLLRRATARRGSALEGNNDR